MSDTPFVPRAQLAYDRTDPSADNLREAAQDLLDEMPEVGDPKIAGWGRKASVQHFKSEAEQRAYLRLVRELQPERGLSLGWVFLLGLGAAGLGALVGWIIRKHREKAAQVRASRHIGLDLFGTRTLTTRR